MCIRDSFKLFPAPHNTYDESMFDEKFDEIDANGDGVIDKDEMLDFMWAMDSESQAQMQN